MTPAGTASCLDESPLATEVLRPGRTIYSVVGFDHPGSRARAAGYMIHALSRVPTEEEIVVVFRGLAHLITIVSYDPSEPTRCAPAVLAGQQPPNRGLLDVFGDVASAPAQAPPHPKVCPPQVTCI